MKNNKHRIRKLESALQRRKATWYLTDGVTQVSAYNDELWDCFTSAMRRRPHPLLESVINANPQTYDGDSTVLSLIQKLHESRRRQLDTAN